MGVGVNIGKSIEIAIFSLFGIFLIVACFNSKIRKKITFISDKHRWLYLVLGIISLLAAVNYAFS